MAKGFKHIYISMKKRELIILKINDKILFVHPRFIHCVKTWPENKYPIPDLKRMILKLYGVENEVK